DGQGRGPAAVAASAARADRRGAARGRDRAGWRVRLVVARAREARSLVSTILLRHRIEYGLVVAVRGCVRVLPESASRGLGTFVGWLFYIGDPAHRRLAIRQLRAAFPTRSEAECRAIARSTFAHFGRLLVTLLRFSRLTPEQIRARVEYEGDERVRAALQA